MQTDIIRRNRDHIEPLELNHAAVIYAVAKQKFREIYTIFHNESKNKRIILFFSKHCESEIGVKFSPEPYTVYIFNRR